MFTSFDAAATRPFKAMGVIPVASDTAFSIGALSVSAAF